ncbi:MAG TPA: ACT domain-containing protein, partial [Ruminococcaceae bacterium]|nr:ACT domain-containing protein [Oscillospiraceae bacterium]
DGVASVSVSARIDELTIEEDELIARLKAVDGIVEVKYITSR